MRKYGGALQAWRRVGKVVAPELWRHAAGVATRRYGGVEAGCRRADVGVKEVWSSEAPEARCRRVDVEV